MEEESIKMRFEMELYRSILPLAVLKLLEKEWYGCELRKTLEGNYIELDENTLYALLRRLEKYDLIVWRWGAKEGSPRKVYMRTEQGMELCQRLEDKWKQTADGMRDIIGGKAGKKSAEKKQSQIRIKPALSSERNKVLWAIQQINKSGKGAGRRSIYSFLKESQMLTSEMKIRQALNILEEEGRILVEKGRGGVRIIKNPIEKI